MNSVEALFGFSLARSRGLKLREISWWSFDGWKKAGMTHVCLSCAPSPVGFRIEAGGKVVGEKEIDTYYLSDHGPDCDLATIPNLRAYGHPADWIGKEVKVGCPHLLVCPEKF
jgi:hypothetical protein